MTPLAVPSIPGQPVAKHRSGGGSRVALALVLVLIVAGTLLAMRPPRSLDAFLRANGVQLPTASRARPAPVAGAPHSDSLAATRAHSPADSAPTANPAPTASDLPP